VKLSGIYKPHVTEMQENHFLNLFSYKNSFKEHNYLFFYSVGDYKKNVSLRTL